MKKLIWFFNVLSISVFCTASAFAVETSQLVANGVSMVLNLATIGVSFKVCWAMLKIIMAM